MGSGAGWKDLFSLGAYSAQKKAAQAQAAAAEKYATAQEKTAEAIKSSSMAQPKAVSAPTASTQQAAESNLYGAQKRKRAVASTVNQRFRGLGNGGGKTNIGDE